jgi:hypothetical protein
MSMKKLVSVCAFAFVVAGLGGGVVAAVPLSEVAQASDEVDPQAFVFESLGPSPNPVDVWSLQCGPGTVYAEANVYDYRGLLDGVTLRVTLVNPLGRAATQMAPDNGFSPFATLNTGPGNYLVIITKSSVGAPPAIKPYGSVQRCLDAARRSITPHSVQLIQDQ